MKITWALDCAAHWVAMPMNNTTVCFHRPNFAGIFELRMDPTHIIIHYEVSYEYILMHCEICRDDHPFKYTFKTIEVCLPRQFLILLLLLLSLLYILYYIYILFMFIPCTSTFFCTIICFFHVQKAATLLWKPAALLWGQEMGVRVGDRVRVLYGSEKGTPGSAGRRWACWGPVGTGGDRWGPGRAQLVWFLRP